MFLIPDHWHNSSPGLGDSDCSLWTILLYYVITTVRQSQEAESHGITRLEVLNVCLHLCFRFTSWSRGVLQEKASSKTNLCKKNIDSGITWGWRCSLLTLKPPLWAGIGSWELVGANSYLYSILSPFHTTDQNTFSSESASVFSK